MIPILWSPTALAQLEAIAEYVRATNPSAAEHLAAYLFEAGNSLALFPHRGRAVPGTAMRELVTRYPYVIRYRVADDAVRILRIRHTSRRPTVP